MKRRFRDGTIDFDERSALQEKLEKIKILLQEDIDLGGDDIGDIHVSKDDLQLLLDHHTYLDGFSYYED